MPTYPPHRIGTLILATLDGPIPTSVPCSALNDIRLGSVRQPVSGAHRTRSQEAKVAFDDSEMDHPQEMEGELLEAGRERTALLDPADTALDNIAGAIAQRVIGDRTAAPALAALRTGWDNGPNAMVAQPLANPAGMVGFITADALGPAARTPDHPAHPHAADQALELG